MTSTVFGINLMRLFFIWYRIVVCEIDEKLGDNAFETHEVNNGMRPLWVSIHEVIAHNENMVAKNDKKGLSIERET